MMAMRKRRLRVAVFIGLPASALSLSLVWTVRAADAPAHDPLASKSITASTPAFKPARPYWIELTGAQRQALAPLSNDWERLDGQTKKKWVEIARRYPKMNPDEQQHTQERMREWALLTPEQRRVARDSFARVRAMPPEQRAEMLRKYRELPDEKKHELANQVQTPKLLVLPKPHTATSSRREQLSEGAKLKNPAIAAQKAAGPRAPAPAVKPAEVVKPPMNAPASTTAAPVAIPVAVPAIAPPATSSASAPAK